MVTEEDLPVVLPPTYTRQKVYRWPSGETVDDAIADEVPISITYNGISHVVMMASPELLEEFAVGFSLSERIIPDISHIYDIQVKEGCGNGLVVEMEISPRCFFKLKEHRRSMVGRTGCGICGVESLKDVELKPEPLEHTYQFDMNFYQPAMKYFEQVQKVGQVTGSTHAMLAFTPDGEFLGRRCGSSRCSGQTYRNESDEKMGTDSGFSEFPGFLRNGAKSGSDRNRNSFCDFRTDESSTPFSKKMRSDVVRILPRQSSKYLQRSGKTAESLKI